MTHMQGGHFGVHRRCPHYYIRFIVMQNNYKMKVVKIQRTLYKNKTHLLRQNTHNSYLPTEERNTTLQLVNHKPHII